MNLLDNVIDAHGGLDNWNRAKAIDLTFNYSGAVLDLKGFPYHLQPTVTIDTKTPRSVFQRLGGDADDRWIFTPDRVWIERRDGTVIEERERPREAFAGHVRETPWDKLHLTYFIGYAVWNYLATPFLFTQPGFETIELGVHEEAGERWQIMQVTYPDGFPAHTKVQKLYFDDDFMLKRQDYVTDILGGVGAHYCYDPITVEGLVFPSLRRVVKRTPERPLTAGRTSFLLDYLSLAVRT